MTFQPGDVVRLKSGGQPMVVSAVTDVGVKERLVIVKLWWHTVQGLIQTIDLPDVCLEECESRPVWEGEVP
jgi:hypothetical protein